MPRDTERTGTGERESRSRGAGPGATLSLVEGDDRNRVAGERDRPNLLVAALDETVVEAATRYRRAVRETPERFGVVARPEPTRSASAEGEGAATATVGAAGRQPSLPFTTATVDGPDDFAGVVAHVDATLAGWIGADTTVALHGLEAALARRSEEAAFRFLHALTRSVTASGARLVVTVDPTDADPTVFEPLFDAVVDRRSP